MLWVSVVTCDIKKFPTSVFHNDNFPLRYNKDTRCVVVLVVVVVVVMVRQRVYICN